MNFIKGRVWQSICITATLLGLIACSPVALPEVTPASNESEPQSTERELAVPTTSSAEPTVPAVSGDASQSSQGESRAAVVEDRAEVEPAVDQAAADSNNQLYNDAGIPVGFTADGHPYIGDLDAPLVIQEYSDFQCPFCARFYSETFPQIVDNAVANGDAVVIFYDFPLNFHPQADEAANAARCAGEQSAIAYWEMHDLLFEDIGSWSLNDPTEVFLELGDTLGLDSDDFADCVTEFRYQAEIEADLAEGQSRGVTGTPTFFLNDQLNDQMLVGAQPYAAFDRAIAVVASGESIATETPEPVNLEEIDIPPFQMPEQVVVKEDYAAVMGDPDAPILIVEYTDYQCPFCSRHSIQTMDPIRMELIETGRVRYALKDFPLDSIHPNARQAATAARCAGEQDKYWEMHDIIFGQQSIWSVQGVTEASVAADMIRFGENLELDMDAYETCLNDGRYDDAIQANLDEGIAFGVTGTPAFFVDGYFLSGAQPFDIFNLIVTNVEDGTIEDLFRDAYEAQVERYRAELAQQQATPTPAGPVDVPVAEDDPFIGDPDAPIVVVEYTDFQCPYCSRHFQATFPQIKRNFIDTGLVKYVFKDFPLNFHPQAGDASEAARCADEQDAFLLMHDMLFASQGEWNGRDDAVDLFIGYAETLDLDKESFAECMLSDRYAQRVADSLQEGQSLGVTGTPSFFINGNLFVGAQPYNNFESAINSMLAELELE